MGANLVDHLAGGAATVVHAVHGDPEPQSITTVTTAAVLPTAAPAIPAVVPAVPPVPPAVPPVPPAVPSAPPAVPPIAPTIPSVAPTTAPSASSTLSPASGAPGAATTASESPGVAEAQPTPASKASSGAQGEDSAADNSNGAANGTASQSTNDSPASSGASGDSENSGTGTSDDAATSHFDKPMTNDSDDDALNDSSNSTTDASDDVSTENPDEPATDGPHEVAAGDLEESETGDSSSSATGNSDDAGSSNSGEPATDQSNEADAGKPDEPSAMDSEDSATGTSDGADSSDSEEPGDKETSDQATGATEQAVDDDSEGSTTTENVADDTSETASDKIKEFAKGDSSDSATEESRETATSESDKAANDDSSDSSEAATDELGENTTRGHGENADGDSGETAAGDTEDEKSTSQDEAESTSDDDSNKLKARMVPVPVPTTLITRTRLAARAAQTTNAGDDAVVLSSSPGISNNTAAIPRVSVMTASGPMDGMRAPSRTICTTSSVDWDPGEAPDGIAAMHETYPATRTHTFSWCRLIPQVTGIQDSTARIEARSPYFVPPATTTESKGASSSLPGTPTTTTVTATSTTTLAPTTVTTTESKTQWKTDWQMTMIYQATQPPTSPKAVAPTPAPALPSSAPYSESLATVLSSAGESPDEVVDNKISGGGIDSAAESPTAAPEALVGNTDTTGAVENGATDGQYSATPTTINNSDKEFSQDSTIVDDTSGTSQPSGNQTAEDSTADYEADESAASRNSALGTTPDDRALDSTALGTTSVPALASTGLSYPPFQTETPGKWSNMSRTDALDSTGHATLDVPLQPTPLTAEADYSSEEAPATSDSIEDSAQEDDVEPDSSTNMVGDGAAQPALNVTPGTATDPQSDNSLRNDLNATEDDPMQDDPESQDVRRQAVSPRPRTPTTSSSDLVASTTTPPESIPTSHDMNGPVSNPASAGMSTMLNPNRTTAVTNAKQMPSVSDSTESRQRESRAKRSLHSDLYSSSQHAEITRRTDESDDQGKPIDIVGHQRMRCDVPATDPSAKHRLGKRAGSGSGDGRRRLSWLRGTRGSGRQGGSSNSDQAQAAPEAGSSNQPTYAGELTEEPAEESGLEAPGVAPLGEAPGSSRASQGPGPSSGDLRQLSDSRPGGRPQPPQAAQPRVGVDDFLAANDPGRTDSLRPSPWGELRQEDDYTRDPAHRQEQPSYGTSTGQSRKVKDKSEQVEPAAWMKQGGARVPIEQPPGYYEDPHAYGRGRAAPLSDEDRGNPALYRPDGTLDDDRSRKNIKESMGGGYGAPYGDFEVLTEAEMQESDKQTQDKLALDRERREHFQRALAEYKAAHPEDKECKNFHYRRLSPIASGAQHSAQPWLDDRTQSRARSRSGSLGGSDGDSWSQSRESSLSRSGPSRAGTPGGRLSSMSMLNPELVAEPTETEAGDGETGAQTGSSPYQGQTGHRDSRRPNFRLRGGTRGRHSQTLDRNGEPVPDDNKPSNKGKGPARE